MTVDEYESEQENKPEYHEAGEALGEFLDNYDEELSESDLESTEDLVGEVKNQISEGYDAAAYAAFGGAGGWASAGLALSHIATESASQGDEIGAAVAGGAALGNVAAVCASLYSAFEYSESKPE